MPRRGGSGFALGEEVWAQARGAGPKPGRTDPATTWSTPTPSAEPRGPRRRTSSTSGGRRAIGPRTVRRRRRKGGPGATTRSGRRRTRPGAADTRARDSSPRPISVSCCIHLTALGPHRAEPGSPGSTPKRTGARTSGTETAQSWPRGLWEGLGKQTMSAPRPSPGRRPGWTRRPFSAVLTRTLPGAQAREPDNDSQWYGLRHRE